MSDGAPGAGKFIQPADILREIARVNATRKIAIHTISVGEKSPLLEQLAKQNSGSYVQR
jgi:hypothetical protein